MSHHTGLFPVQPPEFTESDSSTESEPEQEEEETTPLLPSRSKSITVQTETVKEEITAKEDINPLSFCSEISSSEDTLADPIMDSEEIPDLQQQMFHLQQQMCRQLEAAQASIETPVVAESTVVKPTLFRGHENENVDHWLQRFTLYLTNRRIKSESNQTAVQLALHLSGPAESFYYNLPSTVQASYDALKDALKERFSPAHRHL